MAESAPQLPENDIEAAPQQPVQDENAPADDDKRSSSDKYEGQTYNQRLYENRYGRWEPRIPMYIVDFDELSRVNCIYLMNELAKYDQAMIRDKAAPQDIEHVGDLLHRYTTAVQDSKYWSRLPKHKLFVGGMGYYTLKNTFPSIYGDQKDLKAAPLGEVPKSTSGSVDPLRSFLKTVLPRHLTWSVEEYRRREHEEFVVGKTPEDVSPFVDTLARFIVAITGGLSLVVPMLIMRLGETLPKSLTTVPVAVILFSALTSLMFKASNVETLGATAAYAAVLVVFVGTSS